MDGHTREGSCCFWEQVFRWDQIATENSKGDLFHIILVLSWYNG